MRFARISDSTVRRMSSYCRALEGLDHEGKRMISSKRLAERGGVSSAQVRKDLSCFGSFGRRGLGYSVPRLLEEIRSILGLNRTWTCVLVGAGHIGSALYSYQDFRRRGFDIKAIFDNSDSLIAEKWRDLEILGMRRLVAETRRLGAEIGIIATPARAAQDVANLLVEAGVTGILNFAPRKLELPEEVSLRNVNMTIELESLSYALRSSEARGKRRRAVPLED